MYKNLSCCQNFFSEFYEFRYKHTYLNSTLSSLVKLETSKYIDNTSLATEFILEFSSEFESVFFAGLTDISHLIFSWHLVEEDASCLGEKWYWPKKDISNICCSSWNNDIILSLVIWIFCKILCSILDSSDIFESNALYKMIHCFNFFANTIQKSDIQFWNSNLEWNTRKSSTRTDIKKTRIWILGKLDYLLDDTHSIEWIDKVLFYDTLCITNCREIGMWVVFYKKREKLFKLN